MEHYHYLCSTFVSRIHKQYMKKDETKAEEPKGFKEQIQELAKYKSPKEMTLVEYRQYLKEKISKMMPPLMGAVLCESVDFSDMALVEMKTNPEVEEMVLRGLVHEYLNMKKDEKVEYVQVDVHVHHIREKKQEQNEALERRRLRKKRIEIWFEKRAVQRENYTRFLETGERYATPCPAVEMLALMQATGGFVGL